MDLLTRILDRIGTADVIAVTFTLVSSYLFVTTGDIPEALLVLTTTIVGFFFGKRQAEQVQQSTIQSINPQPAPPLVGDE